MAVAAARRVRCVRETPLWRRRAAAASLLAAALVLTCAVPYLLVLYPGAAISGGETGVVVVAREAANSTSNSLLEVSVRLSRPTPELAGRSSEPMGSVLGPDRAHSDAQNGPPLLLAAHVTHRIKKSRKNKVDSGSGERDVARPRLELPKGLMTPDEELMYARREIHNAPLVTDDPDLYAPIFWNVSVFKRSYELMESILKVYIYPDGARPIFHTPFLNGIYASEGWFMKLMEGNKAYVVKDPSKAHLFYLPYSARQLQLALYVPGSHNMRPLSIFLKDYINTLSAKYPFWNRTRGRDHFLVACHDWGPYTTTLHEEFCKNTIKALCNADVSEGIFVRGNDVSLPETTIKVPKRPLRNLGGKRVSQRSILAFFAGNMHGRVRPILIKHWEEDEDMRIFRRLPNRVSREMSYVEHMKTSKFCICPMGFEVNSPRIVEAIYYECVPVIIADNFAHPFDDVLDWNAFSVIVAEKDIPNLKEILLGISLRQYIYLQTNVKNLQKHFLWHDKPVKYDVFHMILHSIWFSRLNQFQIQP